MRGNSRRRVPSFMDRAGIRTGLRWKLSAAIALVGTLVAIALSLVVHNAARVSMLDNARDLADERVQIAQRNYELSGRPNFPSIKIDDPRLPSALRRTHAGSTSASIVYISQKFRSGSSTHTFSSYRTPAPSTTRSVTSALGVIGTSSRVGLT